MGGVVGRVVKLGWENGHLHGIRHDPYDLQLGYVHLGTHHRKHLAIRLEGRLEIKSKDTKGNEL